MVTVSGPAPSTCMTRRIGIIGSLLFYLSGSPAIVDARQPASAGALALVGAGSGAFAPLANVNPATERERALSVGIVREYALTELTSSTLLVESSSAGVWLRHLAFEGYREFEVHGRSATAVAGWRLGAGLEALSLGPSGFGSQTRLRAVAGLAREHGSGSWGVVLATDELSLGSVLSVGGWAVLADLTARGDQLRPRLGWRFRVQPGFELLGGWAYNPTLLGIGLRARTGQLNLGLGMNRHPVLGWSIAVEVGWG